MFDDDLSIFFPMEGVLTALIMQGGGASGWFVYLTLSFSSDLEPAINDN